MIKYVFLIIAMFAIIAMALVLSTPSYDFTEIEYKVVNGDSLWKICSNYCPDGMDRWDYIRMVEKENNLENEVIQPGQVLTLFVEAE